MKRFWLIALLLMLFSFLGCSRETKKADLLIREGRVFDGSGGPARTIDIAIRNGRIMRMGSIAPSAAKKVISAAGYQRETRGKKLSAPGCHNGDGRQLRHFSGSDP